MPDDNNQDPIKTAAEEALRIAKELEEKMKGEPKIPVTTGAPDPEEIKKQTGLNDASINFIVNTATAASAEANARSAKAQVKEQHKDFSRYEKNVDAELAKYPVDRRGSPELVEKIYFMERGKDDNRQPGGDKPGTKIRSSGNSDTGLDNGGDAGGDPNDPANLTNEEKYVARKLNLKPEQYAKAKSTKLIHELRD